MKQFESIKLAVVGHIEWMTFLKVDHLPQPGLIGHASKILKEPAGGGSVSAVQMSNICGPKVKFFTALGKDDIGTLCAKRLKELGLDIYIAWRDLPTRQGISMVDSRGERAITVIGDRLQPEGSDPLPWEELSECDGVFVTATDAKGLINCRKAKTLVATPRVGIDVLQNSQIGLDALIGSANDPSEKLPIKLGFPKPRWTILTDGKNGGKFEPGGRYKSFATNFPIVDSYGCGDSFPGSVTAAISSGMSIENAVELGAKKGSICNSWFGPYQPKPF